MKKPLKRRCIIYVLGILIYAGAVLGTAHFMMSDHEKFALFLVSYLVAGYGAFQVLSEAIISKKFPVEYILVVFATIGAFSIGRYTEAVLVMLLFELGMLTEQIATDRTKRSIAKMIDLRPAYAIRKVKGQEVQVDPSELKLSHIIVIKPGERVPVDAVVLTGTSMIDTKAITGEAMPVDVCPGDKIYSGCINLNGVLEARVTKVYKDSVVSRIMETVEEAQERKSQKEAFVTRFSRVYVPLMLLIAVLVMVIPPMTFSYGNWETWIYKGMNFMIVACPCALAVTAPLAFLGGVASAARQGIIVKGGNFLESLVKADTFVFDKTGTLTQGEFRVTKVKAVGMAEEELLKLVANVESYSNHPLAKSLADAYGKELDPSSVRSIKEKAGFGISATYEGQRVHVGSRRMMTTKKLQVDEVEEPGTVVYVCVDKDYAGYVLVQDQIKDEAEEILSWLKDRYHAIIVMLTGDTEKTGRAVGRVLHMDYVYTDLLPEDKLEQLEEFMEIQGEAEKLVCVGDGINDAPMLARADVGIAMGNLGSAAAIEAADIILMEDDLQGIVNVMKIAKETLRSVSQNITFAVLIKTLVLFMVVIGYFGMWEAILSEIVVVILSAINASGVAGYRA